jgi:hypothetical protein
MLRLRHTRHDARPNWYVQVMFYCRGGAERCLEEVQLAPRYNLLLVNKITFGHGAMSSGHSTISRPHPALKRYKQRVHTMNELMVLFQHWAGSADDYIDLFFGGRQKL